ncbi:hypothetical protein C479_11845 [Halovivax asiaticus JCM 14624]|uniref:Uncharacterized protein n=1 Tax=Halovivax asiaticus JCM 14624 TaxID=1227490 RepID=M0BIS7_9EURY|nr:hypothetical protein C479_11845 [Halovivax asiaticus JCM 14624]
MTIPNRSAAKLRSVVPIPIVRQNSARSLTVCDRFELSAAIDATVSARSTERPTNVGSLSTTPPYYR